jgi:hypothetical protein
VDEDARHLAPRRHVDERVQVSLMAVDAAVGHEADEVQRVQPARDAIHRGDERVADEEVGVADAFIDPREVLVNDAAGAHVQVADFGVAHLPGGQADGLARRDELRVRIAAHQLVVDRRPGHRDGVVLALGADAPAVEDDEGDGWSGGRGHASCLIADRPA